MQASPVSTEKPTRRRYSAAFRQQVVEESFNSQLSVARVAMKHGLNANLLHTWRWHYRRERGLSRSSSPEGFEPTASLVPAYVSSDRRIASSVPSHTLPTHGVEVRIGAATILIRHSADVGLLRDVVQALST